MNMDFSIIKKNKPLLTLTITGIAIFPSLFLGAKILGVVFLLFFASVIWNIYSLMGGNILSRLADDAWEKAIESKNDKKYFKSSIYFIVFPMVIVGLIMVLLQIYALIFLM